MAKLDTGDRTLDPSGVSDGELVETVPIGLFRCDAEGHFVELNPRARRLLSVLISGHEGVTPTLDELHWAGDRPDWRGVSAMSEGTWEVRLGPDEDSPWGLLTLRARADPDLPYRGALVDITCQKRLEEDLRRSADDKEHLLREVYHRVYNNLQIVLAMLGMQARQIADPTARAGYEDIAARIQAMALLQRELHRGESFASVAFDRYLKSLAQSLHAGAPRPAGPVSVEADPVRLSADRAVTLALVANELIAGALKHGTGTVRVELHTPSPHRFELAVVAKSGAPPLVAEGVAGVAETLVRGLVRQLGASIAEERSRIVIAGELG